MTTTQVPVNAELPSQHKNTGNSTSTAVQERRPCRRCSWLKRDDDGEGFLRAWTPKWIPTSEKHAEKAERKILECLTTPYESLFVDIDDGQSKIRTLKMNPSNSTKTPYVLVHGFASGVALWSLNIESFAKNRPVYAIDLLGFGRSSRPKFPIGAEAAEGEFVRSIEEWRKAVNLDQMILVGHSMGGFLSSAYSLKHPDRVKHLVLVDPWGYPKREIDEDAPQFPFWIRVIGTIALSFNPLSSLRAAGPLGPWLVRKARGDIQQKFSSLFEDDRISQYIYHSNAQYPSGEKGFKDMSTQGAWAANPMIDRIGALPNHIPMSIIFGSRSWMDISTGDKVRKIRSNARVDVRIIGGAGHHVYADKSEVLNSVVNSFCKSTT